MTKVEGARNVWIFDHFSKTQLKEEQSGRLESLAFALSDLGIRSVLFLSSTLHPSGESARFRKFPAVVVRRERVTWVYIWTPKYANSNTRQRALNAAVYTLLGLFVGWSQILSSSRPTDVIGSTMHYGAPMLGAIFAKISGARFFFEARDVWPEIAVDVGRWKRNSPLVKFFRGANKIFAHLSSAVISPLPNYDRYLEDIGVRKDFIWFPNCLPYDPDGRGTLGAHPSRSADSESITTSSEHEFLYMGSFGELYDFVGLMRGFEILVERFPNHRLQLTFLGSGAREEEIRREISRSGCRSKIRVEESVDGSAVPLRLKRSACLLLAYRNFPTLLYGISPLKLADYLAAAKPIIVSRLGEPGMSSLLGIGFEAGVGNSLEIADSMQTVLRLTQKEVDAVAKRAELHLLKELSFSNSSRNILHRLVAH